jgi:hypothetical protein
MVFCALVNNIYIEYLRCEKKLGSSARVRKLVDTFSAHITNIR